MDEQDEIARRLNELMGDTQQQNEQIVDDAVYTDTEQITTSDDTAFTETAEENITSSAAEDKVESITETVDKSIFDVNQDNAEDFLQNFEERA